MERTTLAIHFEDRSGNEFERLTFAFISRQKKWDSIEWIGQTGDDGGRDIWGQFDKETYCYQCANYRNLTFKKAKEDIDKLFAHKTIPDNFILVCGGRVTADMRKKVIAYANSVTIKKAVVWTGVEFEELIRKDTPELIKRFVEGEKFPRDGTAKSYGFVTWNEAPNDCKSLSIINATTNQGYKNPCWPLSVVKARIGEVINVRIYYHNTGIITATNTRLVLIPSTSIESFSKTKSFTGRIISDQGSSSFGPVTAKLSSPQSLIFLSAKWYTKNIVEKSTPLIKGQNGEEIMTEDGLAIGSIVNGWSSQGSLAIAFEVSD